MRKNLLRKCTKDQPVNSISTPDYYLLTHMQVYNAFPRTDFCFIQKDNFILWSIYIEKDVLKTQWF